MLNCSSIAEVRLFNSSRSCFMLCFLFSLLISPLVGTSAAQETSLPEFRSRCQFPSLKTKAKALAEKTKSIIEASGAYERAAVIITTKPESITRPVVNYDQYLNDIDIGPLSPNDPASLKFVVGLTGDGEAISSLTPPMPCEAINVTFTVNVLGMKRLPDGKMDFVRDRHQTVIPKVIGIATR